LPILNDKPSRKIEGDLPSGLLEKFNRTLNHSPSDLIYWTRLCLAIIAAFLCAIFKLDVIGLAIGLFFYLLSYPLVRYILKIGPDKVDSESKLYTVGLVPYFLVWITLWVLLYTYLV